MLHLLFNWLFAVLGTVYQGERVWWTGHHYEQNVSLILKEVNYMVHYVHVETVDLITTYPALTVYNYWKGVAIFLPSIDLFLFNLAGQLYIS